MLLLSIAYTMPLMPVENQHRPTYKLISMRLCMQASSTTCHVNIHRDKHARICQGMRINLTIYIAQGMRSLNLILYIAHCATCTPAACVCVQERLEHSTQPALRATF